ncbi:Vacuolar protein sorting-associated protein 8 homolog [Linum perenne]
MTKNLTAAVAGEPSIELDLDSFLKLHATSDDDEDTNSLPHRSLDEILNDSDSSPSPPSSPTSRLLRSPDSHPQPLNRAQSLGSGYNSGEFKSDSFARVRASLLSADRSWRGASATANRTLPSLFGGVRSNVKPGAALAAAAAASRSLPTPHAAAIKSRRSGSATAAALQKVLESDGDFDREIGSTPPIEGRMEQANEPGSSGEEIAETKEDENEVESEIEVDERAGNAESEVSRISDAIISQSLDDSVAVLSPIEVKEDVKEASVLADDVDDGSALLVKDESSLRDQGNEDETIEKDSALEEVVDGDQIGIPESTSDEEELASSWEHKLQSENISRREHKLQPVLKPLELAEELEMKQASTGLHLEEGAAAQPMRLEGVRRGSITLGYFDNDANNIISRTLASQAFKRDHGSPQVLAVHLNYIAVGMSKGLVFVVPSKYSAQTVDTMDTKMLMLGMQGDRSHAQVTSICFNHQGDMLLAGYGDGHVTVWDLQKASVAKVITGEHNAPVVHAFFLGQDSQASRQFKAVTGDSKGVVVLHSFSVVPLLNRFNIKTQCLLDGQKTGIVLSASPLIFEEFSGAAGPSLSANGSISSSSIGSMMGGVVGGDAGWKLFNEGSPPVEEGVVIFATHKTALVIRLTPTVEVYAELSRPDGVREGSLPYTAWKSTTQTRSSLTENVHADAADRVSLLAVAWDRKVQVAKLVKSELKIYGSWFLDSAAIGVAWLDTHMLVVLTITNQLYLFANDGTLIHQTVFSVDGSRGDDPMAYHTHFMNIYGNPEKAFHNCISVRGASIYVLGTTHLLTSRLLPWKERIQVLHGAGDWMGALNMGMTFYDGQAHGVIDLPRSLDAVQEAIMPYLVELLLSYVDEVFSYISVAFCSQIEKVERQNDSKNDGSVHSEIKEQFTRVGGVAVEFCVHIQRTDILFDEIYSKFRAVKHRDTFLELLEPYILRDMLGSLPPEIMQALVEHYSSNGWLQRVEQCVLHMDISSLDFNQVVRLCREHGLFGALIYLFNKGLDDFKAPLEELLNVTRNSQRKDANGLGYRLLVYLKYCFSGLAFPPGHGALSPTRLPSLRAELVRFLLENSEAGNSQSQGEYPNLYHLLQLDTEATLDVLRCAFVDDDSPKPDILSDNNSEVQKKHLDKQDDVDETQNLLVQNTVDALAQIIETETLRADSAAKTSDDGLTEAWPSKRDIGYVFEFIAQYVASAKAHVSKRVLSKILEYLTSQNDFSLSIPAHESEISKGREKRVLALLEVVPDTDWNSSYVLTLCENAHFYQVCGLIHTMRRQYLAALDSYMKEVGEPIHTFLYINNMLKQLSNSELADFRSAIMSRIPELLGLSREGTLLLVVNHFIKEMPHILSILQSHPERLFLYLKTVIEVHLSGTLDFLKLLKGVSPDGLMGRKVKDQPKDLKSYSELISNFPKRMRTNPVPVTDDMIELYVELLCRYERNSVLKFLETFDSYRVEHCLRLCQEHGIIDAAAFLLERVGDVGSALSLTLSGLNDKFMELDHEVAKSLKTTRSRSSRIEHYNTVDDIECILKACVGLCQRNTPRLQPDQSEMLWFKLLDSFCAPLIDSSTDKSVSKEGNSTELMADTLGILEDDESCTIRWKIGKTHKGAHILRKLFSLFIKEIVEGMIGFIPLPTIMSKLLTENSGHEFGDFKLTILGMLGTYGFERRILDTAKSLIEDDNFYTLNLLKKGASHGYAPRSLKCCICSCNLTKNTSSFRVRVFNCGHVTHLECEFLESESPSKGSPSGCPICMAKTNSQKLRNKSALSDNGLFDKVPRPDKPQGSGMLLPHEDSMENAFGLHQMSRFEILSNLRKDQKLAQVENMPQLRLAPPAVYHERIPKSPQQLLTGGTKLENQSRKLKDIKVKGTSLRFPLKTSIFGKEKITR